MELDRSFFEFYGLDDGQFHSIMIDESPTEIILYIGGELVAIEERAPLPMQVTIISQAMLDEWDRLRDV